MAKIEIDGIQLEVKDGSTIIQAADEHDIYIPRFCYHKKLTVAANCRMCLVEVEKAPKTLPACATPVADGMKIFTKSQKAIDSQKAVMEFLLINHPLDCPVCDQGGQCELQDLAMGFGADKSAFEEPKRAVVNKAIGPLIATEMTRCIHCTRCVRFGEEVAGVRELGLVNRGNHAEIDTYVKHTLQSELSGNIIDLCPVGALTSKPFRFEARAWEMDSHDGISPHDCVGSNLSVNTLRHKVMRTLPRENESVNEVWLSDRDRFSYTGLYHHERLLKPMVKHHGQWQETTWQNALDRAAKNISVIVEDNPHFLGMLLSPSCTTEEAYLAQKLMRGLGSDNIDHRLRAVNPMATQKLPLSIQDIEKQQAVCLIGSNIREAQPILAWKVRKAVLNGGQLFNVNVYHHKMHCHVACDWISEPHDFMAQIATLVKAAADIKKVDVPAMCATLTVGDEAKLIAKALCEAENATIFLGAYVESHPEAPVLYALAQTLANIAGAHYAPLTSGANSLGASQVGAVPVDKGLNTQAMLDDDLAGFIVVNAEPEFDCADQAKALHAMKQAGSVVMLTPYVTETMKQYADVLLPVAPFTETSGTYVNAEGQWQSFQAANNALGEARPAWKVLRVLGNYLMLEGFDYNASTEVLADAKAQSEGYAVGDLPLLPGSLPKAESGLQLVMSAPMFAMDSLTRRAEPLQKLVPKAAHGVAMNSKTAARHQLSDNDSVTIKNGEHTLKLKVFIDDRVPENTLKLAASMGKTAGFGRSYTAVEVLS